MKKSLISIIAFSFVQVWLLAQDQKPVPVAKRKFKHHATIETKYDKRKDITVVRLYPYEIEGSGPATNRSDWTKITAAFIYKSKKLTYQPNFIEFGFISPCLLSARHLVIIADGKEFDAGILKDGGLIVRDRAGSFMGKDIAQAGSLSLPYEAFRKIVEAQTVTVKIEKLQFRLDEETLEALRDMASRMVPE